jgi:N-dimethylarginine dimethylaminohydrolase
MVFTANAGLVRDGIVALSSFHHRERQGEEPHFRRWFSESGFAVRDIPRVTPFEGEGDALFEADGGRLWAGHGPRTREDSHRQLTDLWDVEVVSLRLVDPRFYHLDTCFCPLAPEVALYYPGAFDEYGRSVLKNRIPQLIEVAAEEAASFSCNAVVVGRTVILNDGAPKLAAILEQRGFAVRLLGFSEFIKSGGSAKCLTLRLDGEEAASWKGNGRER